MTFKSERVGGLVSLAGSATVALAGDWGGGLAAVVFWLAEIALFTRGDRSYGYSVGCLLFGLGDTVLCFSRATNGNPGLRLTMALIALTWLAGTFRFPMELLAERLTLRTPRAAQWLNQIATAIQPVIGSLILLQRLPLLATSAYHSGRLLPNPAVFVATCLWAGSDILVGRLQDRAALGWRLLRARLGRDG